MNHKERVISEFEMDFKKCFCLSSTPKNDDFFSTYIPGLKRVWI